MKSFQSRQILYKALMLSLLLSTRTDARDNAFKEVALGATGVVISVAAGYLVARLCSAGLYSAALYRYEPELDLLLRAVFKEQVLEEELIPYILEQHDRNNSLYFFIQSKYKNYPLLYYKHNLDWYINRLWVSKFLYRDPNARHEIEVLISKLERIRRLVVTDYRFVKEQRDFDKQERKSKKAE
jgi:hypothetical protein